MSERPQPETILFLEVERAIVGTPATSMVITIPAGERGNLWQARGWYPPTYSGDRVLMFMGGSIKQGGDQVILGEGRGEIALDPEAVLPPGSVLTRIWDVACKPEPFDVTGPQ